MAVTLRAYTSTKNIKHASQHSIRVVRQGNWCFCCCNFPTFLHVKMIHQTVIVYIYGPRTYAFWSWLEVAPFNLNGLGYDNFYLSVLYTPTVNLFINLCTRHLNRKTFIPSFVQSSNANCMFIEVDLRLLQLIWMVWAMVIATVQRRTAAQYYITQSSLVQIFIAVRTILISYKTFWEVTVLFFEK